MPIAIYLSAAPDAFRDCADRLRARLPRDQASVQPRKMLDEARWDRLRRISVHISRCDLVIHVIGESVDEAPTNTEIMELLQHYPDIVTLPPLAAALAAGEVISRAHWEAWLALYHDVPLLITRADAANADAWQAAHVARLGMAGSAVSRMYPTSEGLIRTINMRAIRKFVAEERFRTELGSRAQNWAIVKEAIGFIGVMFGLFALAMASIGGPARALIGERAGLALGIAAECLMLVVVMCGLFRFVRRRSTRPRPARLVVGMERGARNSLYLWTRHLLERGVVGDSVAHLRAALAIGRAGIAGSAWEHDEPLLGDILLELGTREAGSARLRQAVGAYRAYFDDPRSQRYSATRVEALWSLCRALGALRAREPGAVGNWELVEAYRAAAEAFERSQRPAMHCARVHFMIGDLLASIARAERDVHLLHEAVVAYEAALAGFPEGSGDWALTQARLGCAHEDFLMRYYNRANMERAVAALRAALGADAPTVVPDFRARVAWRLGGVLRRLGEEESDTAFMEQAVVAIGWRWRAVVRLRLTIWRGLRRG